jgi:glutaredoxin
MKNITIYSKEYCPFCVQAKNLLSSLDIVYTEVDITGDADMAMYLYEKSKMRTVPQIYVDDVCIGGYDSISGLHTQ